MTIFALREWWDSLPAACRPLPGDSENTARNVGEFIARLINWWPENSPVVLDALAGDREDLKAILSDMGTRAAEWASAQPIAAGRDDQPGGINSFGVHLEEYARDPLNTPLIRGVGAEPLSVIVAHGIDPENSRAISPLTAEGIFKAREFFKTTDGDEWRYDAAFAPSDLVDGLREARDRIARSPWWAANAVNRLVMPLVGKRCPPSNRGDAHQEFIEAAFWTWDLAAPFSEWVGKGAPDKYPLTIPMMTKAWREICPPNISPPSPTVIQFALVLSFLTGRIIGNPTFETPVTWGENSTRQDQAALPDEDGAQQNLPPLVITSERGHDSKGRLARQLIVKVNGRQVGTIGSETEFQLMKDLLNESRNGKHYKPKRGMPQLLKKIRDWKNPSATSFVDEIAAYDDGSFYLKNTSLLEIENPD